MSAEIIIILYAAVISLLGAVFVLDFMWSRKSDKISREIHKVGSNKTTL